MTYIPVGELQLGTIVDNARVVRIISDPDLLNRLGRGRPLVLVWFPDEGYNPYAITYASVYERDDQSWSVYSARHRPTDLIDWVHPGGRLDDAIDTYLVRSQNMTRAQVAMTRGPIMLGPWPPTERDLRKFSALNSDRIR